VPQALLKPALLLLDAGNTVVFLDHEAMAQAACDAGFEVTGRAVSGAEPVAKRHYEAAMKRGVSHEEGWHVHTQAIFEAAGLPPEAARGATLAARIEHDRFNLWRRVPEGLPEALEAARQAGLRCGIVSNSEGQLMQLLERLDLARLFEHVLDSGVEGVRKPDPEIFRRALERFDVHPSQALYAGDIPQVDVVGARAAGMDGVLIDPLGHYPDYQEAWRFPSVVALLQALGSIAG
jgi:putative hydrolase of the HAD superfamily